MGFYVMMFAFIAGIGLLVIAKRRKKKSSIVLASIGLLFIAFGIYLLWPK